MSTDKKFEWTDELVKDFALSLSSGDSTDNQLIAFKQSKQPPKEERIEVKEIRYHKNGLDGIIAFFSSDYDHDKLPAIKQAIEQALNNDTVEDNNEKMYSQEEVDTIRKDMFREGYKYSRSFTSKVPYDESSELTMEKGFNSLPKEQSDNSTGLSLSELGDFVDWIRDNDWKMYAEGWCQLGGSNGWHCSTEKLLKMFRGRSLEQARRNPIERDGNFIHSPTPSNDILEEKRKSYNKGFLHGKNDVVQEGKDWEHHVGEGEAEGYTFDIKQHKMFEVKEDTKVLFTTEDGVEIRIGDNYWVWDYKNDTPYIVNNASQTHTGNSIGRRYFSTRTAAEQYILENKPCLSLKDLIKVWENNGFNPHSSSIFSRVKEKAKQKIMKPCQ